MTVACIPALRGADGQLVPRGFWSDAASTDARTLPDGKNSDVWPYHQVITCVVLDQELPHAAAYAPCRRFVSAHHQRAALF